MAKSILGEILFYLHTPIFIFWIVPFFIPTSIWSNRVQVHFWYIIALYVIQYTVGLFYYSRAKRIISICPVTIVMQRVRGYAWTDERNWRHGFVAELWTRCGLPTSKGQVNTLQHITLAIVCVQYFLGWLVL